MSGLLARDLTLATLSGCRGTRTGLPESRRWSHHATAPQTMDAPRLTGDMSGG
jgi:hypothetical protein